MSSVSHLLTQGVWTKITTTDKSGSVLHWSGNSEVVYLESATAPIGHDSNTPTSHVTNVRSEFDYVAIESSEFLWAYAINGDVVLHVTPNRDLASGITSGLLVSIGVVAGSSALVKFGHCSDAATGVKTDAWALGASQPVYIFPDVAGENITIESSEGADDQEIAISTLNAAGEEVELTGNLSGSTPVAISGTVRDVNRAYNSDSTPIIGTVLIKGAVSGNVFAVLLPEDQQTTQCVCTIPIGKCAAVLNLSSSINTGSNQDNTAIVTFAAEEVGGVRRTQIIYGLQQRGTSNISSDIILPPVYPPLTRLVISFTPDSLQDVSAELSLQLIDENLLQ
jgi:hypothetical protein